MFQMFWKIGDIKNNLKVVTHICPTILSENLLQKKLEKILQYSGKNQEKMANVTTSQLQQESSKKY